MLSKKTRFVVLDYFLFIGLVLLFTGFFWQLKTTRLQTSYYFWVVLPIVCSLFYHFKTYPFKRLFFFTFLFILYSVLSVFWSDNLSFSTFFSQFKKLILILSLFFAIAYINKKFIYFEKLVLHLMLFCAAFLAFYNIIDLVTTVGLDGRISGWGILDNANITAEVFGMVFIFSFICFLQTKDKIAAGGYFLLCLLFFIEILLNKSRGQQFALFITLILIILWLPKIYWKRLLGVIFGFFIVLLVFYFYSDFLTTIFNRKLTFSCRDTIWRDLLQSALKTPFFGRGEGASSGYITYCSEMAYQALIGTHSVYMNIFLYQGAMGLFLALLVIFYALKTAYQSKYKADCFWGMIIIYGLIAFIPNGDSLLSRPNEMWILFWIPLAFLASRTKPLL